MTTDWLFTLLEKLAHEGFIHHRDVLRCCCVLLSDGPSAHDVLAHRFQVARTHVVPGRALIFVHIWDAVAFADDQLSPVICERRIKCEGSALHSRDVRQTVLQVTVDSIQLLWGVAGERRIHADAHAMVCLKAEVLMLHLLQAADQQPCSREQHDGERGLYDDQSFLWQRGTVAGTTIGSAQCFRRVAMRSKPCRRGAEECSGYERQAKGESQNGQGRRGVDRNEVRRVEGQRDDYLDAEISNGYTGHSSQNGKDNALRERLADQAFSRSSKREAHRRLRTAGGPASH